MASSGKHSALIAHLSGANGSRRRPVRILHNSSLLAADHEVFQQLEDTNALIHKRIASLKTLRSHNKQTNATNVLKSEWQDEQGRLAGMRNKLEKALQSHLQAMIVNSNKQTTISSIATVLPKERKSSSKEVFEGETRADITSIINFIDSLLVDEEKLTNARAALRDSYRNQLSDIKKIIAGAQRSMKTNNNGSANAKKFLTETDGDATSSEQKKVIGGVVADLFLSLRCDHSQTWQGLRQEESDLQTQLLALDQSMVEQFRTETLQKQDAQLQSQLANLLRECTSLNPKALHTGEALSMGGLESSTPTPRSTGRKTSSATGCGPDNEEDVEDRNETDNQPPSTESMGEGLDFAGKAIDSTNSLVNDPALTAILQSYFKQIQCIDSELNHLNDQKSSELNLLHSQLDLDPAVQCGGWSRDDHDVFLKIYRKATTAGMSRKKMMEILTSSLPQQSHESILTHEEFVRGVKRIQTKYKQIEQTQLVKRQEVMIQLTKEVNDYNEEKEERLRYEQQLQQQEAKRKMLHDRLEALQEEKLLVDEEKRIQELMKKEEENQQELQKLKQLEAERQERQRIVAEYREKKRKLLEEQNMRMEMERQRMAEELKKMIEENRSKVELRAHKIAEKNLQRQIKEEELQEQEQKRIAALQKLAEQVPYFDTIQNIDSRLDHVTTSVRGHQYVANEEEITRGHLPLNGFTDQKVIRDVRFRLAEALRMAGISHSTAARDIVQSFNPRPHLAIHGIL